MPKDDALRYLQVQFRHVGDLGSLTCGHECRLDCSR